ncbi:MAG: nucleotidyltransferase domain-containing protein [Candidatus Aminicenantes bacterium]|nr:nucleotidyltransferase domain-containing protein [Candidatus Aminicenantes bacterium]
MNASSKKEVLSYLGEFKKKKRKQYHIVKIGLFGSFSRDQVNEDSDIDVVVELEKPRMFDLIGIKQELEEVFARSVDIVRLRENMDKFLKSRIEREAIYV